MTATIEPLRALLSRVEKATGPDREIDWRIDWMFIQDEWDFPDDFAKCVVAADAHGDLEVAKSYTASIDACVALAERVLPGCNYLFAKGRLTPREPLFGAQILDGQSMLGEAEHDQGPLAFLAAILKAKIAESEG